MVVTITFLKRNGIVLDIDFDSLYYLALKAADSTIADSDIALFFRQSAVRKK